MSDKPTKFDLYGETPKSLLNEPNDFVIDFTVEPKGARDKARRLWRCEAEVIKGDQQ